jgi:carbonic anhydrase
MTCNNSIFPINIKESTKTGLCKIKCNFECDYHNSTCTATNKGSYIKLSYDIVKIPPARLNNVSLDVKEIRLYTPSLHSYEGVKMDGEMVIIHKGFDKSVALCIPIKINDEDESILNEIVDKCSSVIPNEDELTSLTLSDYNLANFVPTNTPFVHYMGNVPFDCGATYDIIAFGNRNEYISIGSIHLQLLQKIISPEPFPIIQNINFFLNNDGIKRITNDNYVRCFAKDELPEEIKQRLVTSSVEGFSGMSSEVFQDFSSIVEDERGIHLGYILLFILSSCGLFLFVRELAKTKK